MQKDIDSFLKKFNLTKSKLQNNIDSFPKKIIWQNLKCKNVDSFPVFLAWQKQKNKMAFNNFYFFFTQDNCKNKMRLGLKTKCIHVKLFCLPR
jgi:hypothetical protein